MRRNWKLHTLFGGGEDAKWCSHCREQFVALNKLNVDLPRAILFQYVLSMTGNRCLERHLYKIVHSRTIHNNQKQEAPQFSI
jgi:hypothetical protein